jgi:hypothetical protein
MYVGILTFNINIDLIIPLLITTTNNPGTDVMILKIFLDGLSHLPSDSLYLAYTLGLYVYVRASNNEL